MLSCKQASQLLSERQERRLGLRERAGMRLHLWLCAECRRFARQLDALRRALRRGRGDEACCSHHELPAQGRERIARALNERLRAEDRGQDRDQDQSQSQSRESDEP